MGHHHNKPRRWHAAATDAVRRLPDSEHTLVVFSLLHAATHVMDDPSALYPLIAETAATLRHLPGPDAAFARTAALEILHHLETNHAPFTVVWENEEVFPGNGWTYRHTNI